MSEQVITTKRGIYGRVQVTLPLQVKTSMLTWATKSGMGKAQFLRATLMMGAIQMAESIQAKKPDEGYYSDKSQDMQANART
jgi:hypothetical protein